MVEQLPFKERVGGSIPSRRTLFKKNFCAKLLKDYVIWRCVLSSLIDRFNALLPVWIPDIKRESHKKVMRSRLILDCREGNKEAMKTLMIRYWPFVDEFPEIIRRHQIRISAREFLRHPLNSLFFIDKVSRILGEIKSDEKDHRSLWLDTSLALELDEEDLYLGEDFYGKESTEVRKIIEKVGESVSIFGNKTASFDAFLRLAAVEIVAESISHELIVVFNDLGDKAITWFRAHIYHKEGVMSHEELVYRLAFSFNNEEPDKEKTNKVIQEVVDLFIAAGDI